MLYLKPNTVSYTLVLPCSKFQQFELCALRNSEPEILIHTHLTAPFICIWWHRGVGYRAFTFLFTLYILLPDRYQWNFHKWIVFHSVYIFVVHPERRRKYSKWNEAVSRRSRANKCMLDRLRWEGPELSRHFKMRHCNWQMRRISTIDHRRQQSTEAAELA